MGALLRLSQLLFYLLYWGFLFSVHHFLRAREQIPVHYQILFDLNNQIIIVLSVG